MELSSEQKMSIKHGMLNNTEHDILSAEVPFIFLEQSILRCLLFTKMPSRTFLFCLACEMQGAGSLPDFFKQAIAQDGGTTEKSPT